MSIKDRLAKKTEGLFVPGKTEGAAPSSPAPLRTSPGQMLMVNSLMKESNEKVALLEERLKAFEGVLPVRLIDADKIVGSKWANRITDSFESAAFQQLKEEIAQAEGNVQPIKVRPLKEKPGHYEIVFGHRRHRACLELGLPVLAFEEEVSDKDLFKEMDRENRSRLDLSPWEQGRMYRRALDEGLFASLGDLAKEVGVDKGNLSKALRLAELPDVVVNAFPSPLDLQYRWAKLLSDAMQRAPDEVLARAGELAENKRGTLAAKEVLDILIGATSKVSVEFPVEVGGEILARVFVDGQRVSVQFAKGAVATQKTQRLQEVIKAFLKE